MSNTYVIAKNGMGSYLEGTGMREDMLMQAFNIFNYQAGVVLSTDLTVTETSPASMAVKVAAGRCFVQNSSYTVNTANSTKYWGVLCEEFTLAVDTNTSGSNRVDLVIVKVNPGATPNSFGTNVATVEIVKGAAGGATPSLPNHSLLLATLTIPTATTTSITNAMIADNRVLYGTSRIKNAAGNIEVYEGAVDQVIQVIVPPTGDLTDALTNSNYTSCNYEVFLLDKPGGAKYTLTTTPTINSTMSALRGVGKPTINSTSGGTSILAISGFMLVENLVLDLDGSTTPTKGITTTGNNGIIRNIIGILGSSSYELIAGSGDGWSITEISAVDLLFGGGKLFNWGGRYSKIEAYASTPQAGLTWALSGDRNIVEVICDTAGSNTGTGNNVTEVVF